MIIMTASKLERLRLEAKSSGSSPHKMAKYSTAKHDFEALTKALFDEDNPYASRPSDEYLRKLEERAKETGAEEDAARYELMKDQRELFDGNPKQYRATVQELRQLIESGAEITAQHVKEAGVLAAAHSSIDNCVLFSAMKRKRQEQLAGAAPVEDDKPMPVTETDVQEARAKATVSGRIEDRVKYADLKRQISEQGEA
ncbi:hypothetical protein [Paenibacillus sp. Leaf72]|uniref:hypothetical protein n=1 Tax=Paenibacillus sp. Leaf72 TaxID=1736234 RepID=UPI000701C701|nr:hypothetical protein [Paenibacillus sp. Leaf72]KQN97586.1 hypothetical protein ASF12_20450 [Paenibacillus sp. Leaf72]